MDLFFRIRSIRASQVKSMRHFSVFHRYLKPLLIPPYLGELLAGNLLYKFKSNYNLTCLYLGIILHWMTHSTKK